jgi:hypothetical protein
MPNRTEARPAKAALTHATGRLPPLRLFSTPLIESWEANIQAVNCWVRTSGWALRIWNEFKDALAALE